jgi:hypothetical protein
MKSTPFKIFIVLALMIIIGVIIANRRERAVQLKEDVLYIAPKPK